MHLAVPGFQEVMGRVKINFFDVLDKYERWKGKSVKSVLGEISSGVSISGLWSWKSRHPTPTPTPGNFDYPTPIPTPGRLRPPAVLVTYLKW